MNAVVNSVDFPREICEWGLRGMGCAAASFCWALVAGFNAPEEIAGMAAGIMVWVALFAGFCTWQAQRSAGSQSRFIPALRTAALIKFGFSLLGGVGYALTSLGAQDAMLGVGIVGVMPDALLGWMAIVLVAKTVGPGFNQIIQVDSFGWTALITVVDGALVTLVVLVLAAVVLAWWRCGLPLLRRQKLSPVRFTG